MPNSPTLCQKFVAQPLAPVRLQFPDAYSIHYMDDILLASSEKSQLRLIFDNTRHALVLLGAFGLCMPQKRFKSKPPVVFRTYY
jgi:hypothetical protein